MSAVLMGGGCAGGTDEHSLTEVAHALTIVHPGDPEARALPHMLVQHLDKQKQPVAYSMWVDSVICREKRCDVVKVQLHWDALGNYQRYALEKGARLTKLDHVPFSPEDRKQLHLILGDPASPLREVEKDAMVGEASKRAGDSALDGVTGATILTLKNAVIIGAGYTCYDLWHWVNGEMGDRIRAFTGTQASDVTLRAFLAAEDSLAGMFAIEALQKRRVGDAETRRRVVARALIGGEAFVRPAMHYLVKAVDREAQVELFLAFFEQADSRQRVVFLELLLKAGLDVPPPFYEALCTFLPTLDTFHEVQLFFRLCEQQNVSPDVLVPYAAELLSHEKFFVQRRAFAYLEQQRLSPDVDLVVEAYFRKNENRL